MVRHSLKILQQMVQDFLSVSDHFEALCITGLICPGAVCHIRYKEEQFCKLVKKILSKRQRKVLGKRLFLVTLQNYILQLRYKRIAPWMV